MSTWIKRADMICVECGYTVHSFDALIEHRYDQHQMATTADKDWMTPAQWRGELPEPPVQSSTLTAPTSKKETSGDLHGGD